MPKYLLISHGEERYKSEPIPQIYYRQMNVPRLCSSDIGLNLMTGDIKKKKEYSDKIYFVSVYSTLFKKDTLRVCFVTISEDKAKEFFENKKKEYIEKASKENDFKVKEETDDLFSFEGRINGFLSDISLEIKEFGIDKL